MKHFLPSSVMLMPFVVKHYPETDDEIRDDEQQHESSPQLDLGDKQTSPAESGRKRKKDAAV